MMNTIIINDNNLIDIDIQMSINKVRAILLCDNKILLSNYGGVFLLPGGGVEIDETNDEAIIRELKEETGIDYYINDLKKLFVLKYYQCNYPTRQNEIINRLIKTTYYLGQYKGVNIDSTKRTQNEVNDNFNLQLMKIGELNELLKKESDNPRKKFFDRENGEVIKVLKKIKEDIYE